jgi:hypothetical protein
MANWCHNTLKISGEDKDLVAFIERVKDDDTLDILYQEDDGFGCDPEFTDGKLICHFDTKWCPPVEWVEGIAKEFPELTFDLSYSERLMCIYGKRVFNGNTITILDYCDSCDQRKECQEKYWTAIMELMKTPPERWPVRCKGCPYTSICAIAGEGSCIVYECESLKVEPFEEFLKTKGTFVKPIQTAKKDFKRYRKIDVEN